MSVAIIDYGSGNLRSAEKAVLHILQERGMDKAVRVTSCANYVADADHIILPGVGAFGDCMGGLTALDGMIDALEYAVLKQGKPFLGICVGMQLMATEGLEYGMTKGLGWIEGGVEPIPENPHLKIPHMGWNEISIAEKYKPHPLLDGIANGDHMYFVHSYYFAARNPVQIMATVEHGIPLPAMVMRDNMLGTQFHPEKSQAAGLRLIGNFLQWNP